jgi:hypothetical protein
MKFGMLALSIDQAGECMAVAGYGFWRAGPSTTWTVNSSRWWRLQSRP